MEGVETSAIQQDPALWIYDHIWQRIANNLLAWPLAQLKPRKLLEHLQHIAHLPLLKYFLSISNSYFWNFDDRPNSRLPKSNLQYLNQPRGSHMSEALLFFPFSSPLILSSLPSLFCHHIIFYNLVFFRTFLHLDLRLLVERFAEMNPQHSVKGHDAVV